MNAPARIAVPSPAQQRLAGALKEVAEADAFTSEATRLHRRSISIHCPNCNEVEMAARCDLAAIRDQATTGMRRAQVAGGILREVSIMAGDAVFAPISTSRLLRLRASLNLTMIAARDVERAHRDG